MYASNSNGYKMIIDMTGLCLEKAGGYKESIRGGHVVCLVNGLHIPHIDSQNRKIVA